jgi:zinc transport system ATP-binding protein
MVSDAIRCEHLSFGYDDQLILNNISFSIQKGEFIGIIGPNGGGKSTLLKLILGFLKPSSGELDVFCEKIAYVPQNMKFDRHFPISALEVVLQGRLSQLSWHGKFSQVDIEKGLQALARVGLADLADRPFGTLSGGQQQRVLIARALSSEPTLLLLDEPTANLDPEAEKETFAILRSLRNGMTILMVTHDLQIAIDEVDRILVVQRGLISYSPKEVCEHYALGLYHPPLLNIGKSS